MTLRHIKIFRAVCENDYSTTKAAHILNMTQPAISQAIKDIEDYYGTPMFDRIGRRLVITQAGLKLKGYADSIETFFDDMETEMKNWNKQGSIRVGGTMTIGAQLLPLYIKSYQQAYPNAEIKCFCGPSNILEQKILSNQLDFAFSEGMAYSSNIVSEPYMNDSLVVFASAESEYTDGQTISVEEFKKQKLILREQGSGTRKVFDLACEKAGFTTEPMWESVSTIGIINAVINNLGVGVLSHRLVKKAVEKGYLVTLNVEGLNLDRKFYIIRHKDKHISDTAKNFLLHCNNNEYKLPEYL